MPNLTVMFVTAVCFLFLLKLKWPKNKNIYEILLKNFPFKCHYDENGIFSIKAILMHKPVACMGHEKKNAVYYFQISLFVPEIFKFLKYAN